jgi:hypothetical protein
MDPYTTVDFPYNPELLTEKPVFDRFAGYRALTSDDLSVWIQAIEECGN